MLLFLSCNVNAQKKSSTLIGFQVGNSNIKMTKSFLNYKIGLPSFSYSSSVEKRLTLNNNLSFSLQYSINYFSFNKRMLNTTLINQKEVSNSINVNTNFKVIKKTSLLAGVGVNKSLYTKNIASLKIEGITNQINENKFTLTDFNKFNPYFIIGIENGIQLLNKNLYYSLQYNFGFNSLKSEIKSNETNNNTGFRIGLKYKH